MKQQQRMCATLNALADMVILIDSAANILDVNQAFIERFGGDRDSWGNERLGLVASQSDREISAMIDECRREQQVTDQLMDWSFGDQALPVLVNFSLLPGEQSPGAVLICAKDITTFKQVEDELRETERRYRYFVEQTQEGFYRLDFDQPIPVDLPPSEFIQKMYDRGFIAECNDIYAVMYGYNNASEMEGARLIDLHGGSDVPENLEAMHAFVRDGFQHLEIETTEYDKQGKAIHLSNNSVGIIQDGLQMSVWGTQRDITQRKQAEIALSDREARLRTILDGAGDAVITTDNHGVIHDANQMTERMFGYQPLELFGKNARILMPQPANDKEAFLAQTHVEGLGHDVVGRRKDRSTFPADIAVREIEELGLYIVNIRDVSDRKVLQREVLSIAEDEQRRIGRDLHDSAQQELAGLGLMAQTLFSVLSQSQPPVPGAPQPLQITEKMIAAIKRTNYEVRRVSQGLVPVSLDAKDLAHALSELAVRTNVGKMRCVFRCNEDVQVHDDWSAMHLYRIAQEAVANALKHAESNQIILALSTDQAEPVLTIEDDGVGFDSSQVREGLGLRTMHYRASLIGATLTITRGADAGTQVVCKVFRQHRDST